MSRAPAGPCGGGGPRAGSVVHADLAAGRTEVGEAPFYRGGPRGATVLRILPLGSGASAHLRTGSLTPALAPRPHGRLAPLVWSLSSASRQVRMGSSVPVTPTSSPVLPQIRAARRGSPRLPKRLSAKAGFSIGRPATGPGVRGERGGGWALAVGILTRVTPTGAGRCLLVIVSLIPQVPGRVPSQ